MDHPQNLIDENTLAIPPVRLILSAYLDEIGRAGFIAATLRAS